MTIRSSYFRALSRFGLVAFVALLVATFCGAARAQVGPPSSPAPAPSPAQKVATEALVPVEETAANVVPPDSIDEALLERVKRDLEAPVLLQTEPAENTYPRLPVRVGEHVIVALEPRVGSNDGADPIHWPWMESATRTSLR